MVQDQTTTAIPEFFKTIEEAGLSMWVRDNPFWAIPFCTRAWYGVIGWCQWHSRPETSRHSTRSSDRTAQTLVHTNLGRILDTGCFRPFAVDRISHEIAYEPGFLSQTCTDSGGHGCDGDAEEARFRRLRYQRGRHDVTRQNHGDTFARVLVWSDYIRAYACVYVYPY